MYSALLEGRKVFPIFLTITVLSVFGYLAYCRIKLSCRNRQSWASIVTRLRSAWGGHESSCHYLWQEGLTVCPDDVWTNIQGASGLWAIFKNAGIMLEMVEFAERNCDAIDPVLLERLRGDALQVRMSALLTLVQSVAVASKGTVRVNAFRAVSMYTGMTARMVQLLDQNAAVAMPEFVAAM